VEGTSGTGIPPKRQSRNLLFPGKKKAGRIEKMSRESPLSLNTGEKEVLRITVREGETARLWGVDLVNSEKLFGLGT